MDKDNVKCCCGLIVIAFNLIVGTICANFLIETFFHQTISLFWTAIIALIGSEVIVPVAIVVLILKSFGLVG